jgi:hypothetical protein
MDHVYWTSKALLVALRLSVGDAMSWMEIGGAV